MWRRPGAYTIASLFSCENRGKRSWVSLTISAICNLSASHRSLRTHLACDAEVLWRGPEAAGGGRRHDRGPVGEYGNIVVPHSPTVVHEPGLSTADENRGAIFRKIAHEFGTHHDP